MPKLRQQLARRLRDELAVRRDTDPTLLDHHLDVRAVRAGVKVRWVGGPLVADVEPIVAQVQDSAGLGEVTVMFDRVPVWSCGALHRDVGDAWLAHEGADLVTSVAVPGCCEHCSDSVEMVDPQLLADHITGGGDTATSCRPEPTATGCLACGGLGHLTNPDTLEPYGCAVCGGRKTLDLADPTQRHAAVEQTRRAHAARAEQHVAAAQRRARKLP